MIYDQEGGRMMRKRASIETVWKAEPIEGADRIELAHVLGWQCVVNKGHVEICS